jgi:transposase
MTRTYGRAPVGRRVYTDTPGSWDSITLTCGLRLCGVTAALAFPGATNTGVFEEYVEKVLAPELKPGDVVIWDNLEPHKSEEAIEAVEAAGAEVVPLPPYSPDLTPIEEMISKVKGSLRSAAARTKETVYAAFGSALHDVTIENIAGWFQDRAAYAMQL